MFHDIASDRKKPQRAKSMGIPVDMLWLAYLVTVQKQKLVHSVESKAQI